jgi:hypothetical protein
MLIILHDEMKKENAILSIRTVKHQPPFWIQNYVSHLYTRLQYDNRKDGEDDRHINHDQSRQRQ